MSDVGELLGIFVVCGAILAYTKLVIEKCQEDKKNDKDGK